MGLSRGDTQRAFSSVRASRGAALGAGSRLLEITGASVFRLEEGLDTGPVYGMVTEAIAPDDTSGALLERLAHSGATLLVATLDGIEAGRVVAEPQPADGVSHAPKIDVDDAPEGGALISVRLPMALSTAEV